MGNLLACFGAPKEGDRRKPSMPEQQVSKRYRSLRTSPAANVPVQWMVPELKSTGQCIGYECEKKCSDDEDPKQPVSDSPEKAETNSPKKKVTFDMNVQTYESDTVHLSATEDVDDQDEDTKKEGEQEKKPEVLVFPSNHRYQNCAISDDEDSEDDTDELYDAGEEDDVECDDLIQEEGDEEEEESFSSYFPKQLEREHQEPGEEPRLSANERARDRSTYIHPVMNPVENLSQWKKVKSGKVALAMKENISKVVEAKVPISPSKPNACPDDQEASVDTSLSGWLTPPQRVKASSQVDSYYSRSNTSTSLDDRPILGALTVDDIKQVNSLSPSPKKTPRRSPDDTPIVGTVGRYWKHESLDSTTKGIPNTTSKYSEDKRVRWHSTPFEERLERALSKVSVADTDVIANAGCSPAVC